ncbi:MAG: bifunctional folylpolyglutamate synthase/dihydrofolate synthase, partial [Candidatus Omnitrophota bacterium]
MNYSQTIDYLNDFVNYEKERDFEYSRAMTLDRMKLLARQLGNPQNAYECVTIAGSKGKGSIAAMVASILRAESYRVGLYTSPHLLNLRERITVGGVMISEARFCEGIDRLRHVLDDAVWRRQMPTYFEMLTALAFWYFKEVKVHAAVLEVGLGGLFDSTNIADPRVVGIAPISLDHTELLGKTISKIAVQKCGIIKGRQIVVTSPQKSEAMAVIE